MKPLRPAYLRIATISVGLSVGFAALGFQFLHLDALGILFKIGLINVLVSLFWLWFEQYGWRTFPCRLIPGMDIPPDLRGRWEGHLKRLGAEEISHPIVFEIAQSYSRINIATFSEVGKSRTLVAAILVDEQKTQYEIIHTWFAEARNKEDPEKRDEFYGTSITDIKATSDTPKRERRLVDYYFTRRNPHTRGHITVQWRQLKLHGKL